MYDIGSISYPDVVPFLNFATIVHLIFIYARILDPYIDISPAVFPLLQKRRRAIAKLPPDYFN